MQGRAETRRMVTIRHCTIAELFSAPAMPALLDDYAAEAAIAGMPTPAAQMRLYQALESSGMLGVIGAFAGGELVGFINILVSELPHYSAKVGTSESFFVAPSHRSGGTGQRLLDAAEEHARNRGAVGLLVSAPHGGRLERALPLMGYRQSNSVFFRGLA